MRQRNRNMISEKRTVRMYAEHVTLEGDTSRSTVTALCRDDVTLANRPYNLRDYLRSIPATGVQS